MARIALLIYSLIGALNILSAVMEQPLLRTFTKPLLMPMLLLYVFSQTHIEIRNKLIFILVFAWLGDMFLLRCAVMTLLPWKAKCHVRCPLIG